MAIGSPAQKKNGRRLRKYEGKRHHGMSKSRVADKSMIDLEIPQAIAVDRHRKLILLNF
jgi:hypothetical protein